MDEETGNLKKKKKKLRLGNKETGKNRKKLVHGIEGNIKV